MQIENVTYPSSVEENFAKFTVYINNIPAPMEVPAVFDDLGNVNKEATDIAIQEAVAIVERFSSSRGLRTN